jgi:hypothetical protein
MGLLDLDKVIIKRTVLGIRCTSCGGNLVETAKPSTAGRIIQIVSLGTIKPKYYTCENCRKRFMLFGGH